jgi:hypothetical protein
MSASKLRLISADETRLSILLRKAADLDLQFYELNKLRHQIGQAQQSVRKLLRASREEGARAFRI